MTISYFPITHQYTSYFLYTQLVTAKTEISHSNIME